MILLNIASFILIFSNFIISILPNKDIVKNSNDPAFVNRFFLLLNILNLSLLLAVILGMISGYIYLIPLLLSKNEVWTALISPVIFIALFFIGFIRIKLKFKDGK